MKAIYFAVIVFLQTSFAVSHICSILSSNSCEGTKEIKYNLYTKNNTFTKISPGNLNNITYNANCPFIFIVHGYNNKPFDPWILKMVNELFIKRCFNVVVVDWSAIVDIMNSPYPDAVSKTCCSGENVGNFIIELVKELNITYSDIHVVGNSLGAHLAGCAGQQVFNVTQEKIGRITGLDAAGLPFNVAEANCRLSPGDGEFVDCIHTDITLAGYAAPFCDADFYPNGGYNQPGCVNPIGCSHVFVQELFSASINNYGFISNQCDSYCTYECKSCLNMTRAEMGYNFNGNARGKFYLDTTVQSPYAMNGTITRNFVKCPDNIILYLLGICT